jgi:hypothetical protein
LKKGIKIGLTGSATAGMNQGFYGNQFAGININNSNGRNSSCFNFSCWRTTFEEIKQIGSSQRIRFFSQMLSPVSGKIDLFLMD